jgi:hypothetical protein
MKSTAESGRDVSVSGQNGAKAPPPYQGAPGNRGRHSYSPMRGTGAIRAEQPVLMSLADYKRLHPIAVSARCVPSISRSYSLSSPSSSGWRGRVDRRSATEIDWLDDSQKRELFFVVTLIVYLILVFSL